MRFKRFFKDKMEKNLFRASINEGGNITLSTGESADQVRIGNKKGSRKEIMKTRLKIQAL